MKQHHLSVVTLEEYEPNREFVGRNFNAGEVIQLVLKSARPPHRWLPFRYVQMVMMHELAHCTQMNHSRAFWAIRNDYAAAMTALWSKGYTGEGIWGRGAALGSGDWYGRNTITEGEPLPQHLCGGTYRSRRQGARKRKPKVSWKEQKERRIAKKFGVHGVALGADDGEKVKLEGGKKTKGKPRVAGSGRGRELRAAAALARFGKQKAAEEDGEELPLKKEEGQVVDLDEDETASGSDYEEEDDGTIEALDLDGTKMKDKDGRALVKVCEDEDANDPSARNELDELRNVFCQPPPPVAVVAKSERENGAGSAGDEAASSPPRIIKGETDIGTNTGPRGTIRTLQASSSLPATADLGPSRPLRLHDIPHIRDAVQPPSKPTRSFGWPPVSTTTARPSITIRRLPPATRNAGTGDAAVATAPAMKTAKTDTIASTYALGGLSTTRAAGKCPLCSLDNDAAALLCAACANVLRPEAVLGSWQCGSTSCSETGYMNAGDCGVCGLCGGRRLSSCAR